MFSLISGPQATLPAMSSLFGFFLKVLPQFSPPSNADRESPAPGVNRGFCNTQSFVCLGFSGWWFFFSCPPHPSHLRFADRRRSQYSVCRTRRRAETRSVTARWRNHQLLSSQRAWKNLKMRACRVGKTPSPCCPGKKTPGKTHLSAPGAAAAAQHTPRTMPQELGSPPAAVPPRTATSSKRHGWQRCQVC